MSRNESRFTVLFQEPFWVGIAERWEEGRYQAAKVTFGAEPTDAQLWQWLERGWSGLKFTAPEEGDGPGPTHRNPKRAQREARRATGQSGASTKAQEALSRQREQDGRARKLRAGQVRRQEEERKFLLRQQKKREKQRGR